MSWRGGWGGLPAVAAAGDGDVDNDVGRREKLVVCRCAGAMAYSDKNTTNKYTAKVVIYLFRTAPCT